MGRQQDCPFEACGGDVVGTWKIDSVCWMDPSNPFASVCPTSTFTVEQVPTGNTVWSIDEASFVVVANFNLSVGCDCGASVGPIPLVASGDWTYDGDDVVFDGLNDSWSPYVEDGDPERFTYCQDGDSLELQAEGSLWTLSS